MTYREALAAGYKNADRQYTQGYVSRKVDIMGLPVQVAKGTRKGELFVNIPSWDSTRYSYRQYLTKED